MFSLDKQMVEKGGLPVNVTPPHGMPVARQEVPGAHFPSAASFGATLKESQELGWPGLLPRQHASHSLSGQ